MRKTKKEEPVCYEIVTIYGYKGFKIPVMCKVCKGTDGRHRAMIKDILYDNVLYPTEDLFKAQIIKEVEEYGEPLATLYMGGESK